MACNTASFNVIICCHLLLLCLVKQPNGTVKRRLNDYASRRGVTQDPVLPDEDLLDVSPLHSLLRLFTFILQLVYHLHADVLQELGEVRYAKYLESKKLVKAHVKERTGISIDAADSSGHSGNS